MRGLLVTMLSLMVWTSGNAWADKQRVGDWTLDTRAGFSEAFTGNDSGSMFGFLCSDTCIFYLDTGTQCHENGKIPMLVNANSGSTYVMSTCVHFRVGNGIRYVYSIQDKDIVTAISSGNIIGFAFPLESGEFKVTRFSLNGALTATGRAVDAIKAQENVRDTRLRDRNM